MFFKYHLKQQSKVMKGIAATFVVLVIIFNLLNHSREWYMLSIMITLLPLFFTSNIFSSEVEKKTDFLIFTSRIPRYKVLIQKYLSAWIISEGIIFIAYLSAVVSGFEKSLFPFMIIVIYSTVLSLIGLLVSNISNNTLLGYGVSLGVWISEMMLGARWHERHTFLSTNVNLINRSVKVWSNILFMIILITILILLNLFIVSRGEHLRRKLTYKGTTAVIAVFLICLFLYNSFFLKLEFWKDNKWTLLKGENINLQYKNLDYDRAKEIFKICNEQSKVLQELFGESIGYNKVYVWHGVESDFAEDEINAYLIPFRSLMKLNPTEYGGKYWYDDINTVLMEPIFKQLEENNENEILKGAWKNYIYYSYISPNTRNKLRENKILKMPEYYNNSKEEYMDNLESNIKSNKPEKNSIHALGSISNTLLYKLDQSNHENTIKLLKYINNSEKSISYRDIEEFIKKNYKDKTLEETLNLYNEIREYHEKHYSDRGLVTED
ncbi:ABC transporter permease [Clostridium lundense]|uniref:ABC transporter permease n=1 Tax=Clostridium lundense TaxID=319475 RepID=UPI0004883279|nr:ABC transporter permease [Clostridium lundense]